MRLYRLKTLRVGVALVVFTLIALVFLDVHNLVAPSVAKGLLYPQFVPSLLQYLGAPVLAASGFIVVVVCTLLFGRVYCSTLCPLGTLQDAIGFVARRKRRRRGFQYSEEHTVLRYTILMVTVLLLLSGSGLLLNLLDPFSSFGRIATNLFRPVLLFVNNLTAAAFEQWGVYGLPRVRWAVFAPASVGVSLATLLLIAWFAARHGRLYCNTLCPVGTLLGLLAGISWLRLTINREGCKGCKLCEDVCKAGCIDSGRKTVDSRRCVSCYNCLTVCRKNGLRFENNWRRRIAETPPNEERRGFLVHSGIFLLGLAGPPEDTKVIVQSKPTTIVPQVTSPASPPGSGSIARYTATCTACHLCVSACPSRVLVPSLFQFGTDGLLQPQLNFHTGHCNYECTICMEVCPSGALVPMGVAQKKLTQLGVAKFIKENCVVYTDNTACGACSEHCPTKAVDMVPYVNPLASLVGPATKDLKIPEMKPEYCIGCGGCEHACPTKPYKAIFVDGNPEHKLAKKPLVKKIEVQVDNNEDFPF
ncbi:MAG: 4Fe-4S dicluster domain-containing protein [Desulforhopalus sp.]|nr:4Fe-4S dicluster domain-containing protein [Desulforhopalus sp.]